MSKKENRGGKRAGSGRKPIHKLSDAEVKRLVRSARRKAKETGQHISDILIDLAYQDGDKRTALSAIAAYYNNVIIKTSEKDVNFNKTDGPAIGLPPKKQDPALKVLDGGKNG